MVSQPKWTELPGRYVYKNRGWKVLGVVLHDTAGNGKHGDTLYLANPSDGRKVCVDFTVERNGSIWKLNPDLENSWTPHAGRKTKFKGLANNDVTKATVGIEICQKADLSLVPIYPDAQIKSVAHLCAWLVDTFKLTTSDITTHRQIITDGSRSDPRRFPFEGLGGFWQYYWEALGKGEEHKVADVMVKTPDIESERRTHNVKQGETLSSIARLYYKRAGDWTRIQKANGLSGTVIVPGQVLIIP